MACGAGRRLAVVAVLIARARAASLYQGCVGIDSPFDDTAPIKPNGPVACEKYCTGNGFAYYAMSAQFCSCSRTPPRIYRKYQGSDCAFNCDPPFESQYCGGMDQETFTFIYDLYFQPRIGAAEAGSPSTIGGPSVSSPTTLIAVPTPFLEPTATSVPGSIGTAVDSSDGDPGATRAAATSTRPDLAFGSGQGAATTLGAVAPQPLATLAQTILTTSIFVCSNGNVEPLLLPTVSSLVYDPAANTIITMTHESTTIVTVAPLATAMSSGPFANTTHNDTPAATPLSSPLTAGSERTTARGSITNFGFLLAWASVGYFVFV